MKKPATAREGMAKVTTEAAKAEETLDRSIRKLAKDTAEVKPSDPGKPQNWSEDRPRTGSPRRKRRSCVQAHLKW
ncbi:MAG: hypothetical protein V6Z86_04645 [Hyphomicrobiales bacterium]